MTHPAEITEQWQSLSEGDDATPPTTEASAFLAWCEHGGYKIHVTGEGMFVDTPTDVDPDTGQGDRAASFQIIEVA
ncbi:hypothetical protein [Flexivirga sp.]|uniref:hypothetical protein n=1 Tax=Flexivirga sp. TaxID=1962927 RepID=UPI003F8107F3